MDGAPGLQRVDSHFVSSLPHIDPFDDPPERLIHGVLNAILATALFRCWHIILFFTGWAAAIALISDKVHNLGINSTLLTVFGTVLGFVISYRTSSSFERYNEGRRYWSSIVYGARTLSRTIWFHVPDTPTDSNADNRTEMRTRTLIEKKSAINLIEAFAVAVKHYLRGEDGIYYEDLYHLVKFLPVYILPAGRPSVSTRHSHESLVAQESDPLASTPTHRRNISKASNSSQTITLPLPNTTPRKQPQHTPTLSIIASTPEGTQSKATGAAHSHGLNIDAKKANQTDTKMVLSPPLRTSRSEKTVAGGQVTLLPSRNPPKYALFDVFPFSLFVRLLARKGFHVSGKKGARVRARMMSLKKKDTTNHNIPLEITFYLSSYISTLQMRKAIDVPTINTMLLGLNQLSDSLTGLERILTTPIPFSYSIHLWSVCTIYCFVLPFQLWLPLKYLSIPATAITAFIFYGFLVAGEEIENPFGYDKNDLNLDHFTHNIIRAELDALTSRPMPDVADWVFHPENDRVFAVHGKGETGVSPKDWLARGERPIRDVLAKAD